jgi:hypothetical protein
MLTNAVVVLGAGLTLIESFPVILIGRFVYGLACGSFSVFVPKFSTYYIIYSNKLYSQ